MAQFQDSPMTWVIFHSHLNSSEFTKGIPHQKAPCLQSATRLVALDETYTLAGHESLVVPGLYTLRSSNMAMKQSLSN